MPTPEELKIIICGGKAQKNAELLGKLCADVAARPALYRKAVRALDVFIEVSDGVLTPLMPGPVSAASEDQASPGE